jgi:hypothetical protein
MPATDSSRGSAEIGAPDVIATVGRPLCAD